MSVFDKAPEYTVSGGDWQNLPAAVEDDKMIINMGPQHPSTHGVLRLLLEMDGEIVTKATPVIGYLHTGIEKSLEYRPWTQGTTFVTRMDYLTSFHNELAYCLGVEKLLGITDEVPERAQAIRVILTEFNRIVNHVVAFGSGGNEMGSTTAMIYGLSQRNMILDLFEAVSGLRMNHAFIRPGGVANDVPHDFVDHVNKLLTELPQWFADNCALLEGNPVWMDRNVNVGVLTQEELLALGVTGPIARAAGIAQDVRKSNPYCNIEQYDFDIPIRYEGDAYARFVVRLREVDQSLRIIRQAIDNFPSGPVMVADKKIAWPAQLALGPDGLGNAPAYIGKIMGQSMESLIHHFKLVTHGFDVPKGTVYASVESGKGELGVHMTSNGANKPWRVHMRDPSFTHVGTLPFMIPGHQIADVVAIIAAVDPVMGGVDR